MNDTENLKSCASSGLATAISEGFIKSNGIVYGVSYTNNYLKAEYSRADTFADFEKFRSSKYVQSRKNNVYDLVREDLKQNKKVLFIRS